MKLKEFFKPRPMYNGKKLTRQEMKHGIPIENMTEEDRKIILAIEANNKRLEESGVKLDMM